LKDFFQIEKHEAYKEHAQWRTNLYNV
jgi:hypothetical protein